MQIHPRYFRGNSGHLKTTTKKTGDDDSDPDGTDAREMLLAFHWKPVRTTLHMVITLLIFTKTLCNRGFH